MASGTFAGGIEWRPPVDEMWLLKNGANGNHNPHLVTAAEWAAFQKVWRDVAARKIDVSQFAGL